MALLNFKRDVGPVAGTLSPEVEAFLQGYSIEVMPRTAQKVDDFRALLPAGTRVMQNLGFTVAFHQVGKGDCRHLFVRLCQALHE